MTDELKQAVERLDELESMLMLMVEDRYFKPLRTILDALETARRDAFEEAAKSLDAWGDIYGDQAARWVRALADKQEQGE